MQQNVLGIDANLVVSNIYTRASNVSDVLKESTWYLQQVCILYFQLMLRLKRIDLVINVKLFIMSKMFAPSFVMIYY